jgi:hypothetical protein
MHRLIVIVIVLAAAAAPVLAQPAVTFSADTVTFSGFPPGAKVVWLSIAREIGEDWITKVVRREGVAQTGAKGELPIAYDGAVAANSGWFAVDLEQGDVAFGTPEGTQWRLVESTAKPAAAGAAGTVHLLRDQREFIELLLVRPSEGAWGYSAGDGGAADDGAAQDGTIRAAFDALRSVGDSAAPPKGPREGDVVVGIDPDRLEAYSFRIGQPR